MRTAEMEHRTIKFSLILATVARHDELERFLLHLDRQTYRNFELIVVDQNPDGLIDPLIREYQERFSLLHLHSGPGLSRARNVGLQHLSGDVVGFPDDDCWYFPDTLERVARALHENSNYAGFTARGMDESRPGDYLFFTRRSGWVDKENVWHRATSWTIFLRMPVIQAVGLFDETLGVGAQSGKHSAEEVDYLIRALACGFRIYYCAELCIRHPYPMPTYDRARARKSFGYSLGFGYVLRKHHYPPHFVWYYWLRPLCGAAVSLLTLNVAKSRCHLAILKGRIAGWLG